MSKILGVIGKTILGVFILSLIVFLLIFVIVGIGIVGFYGILVLILGWMLGTLIVDEIKDKYKEYKEYKENL